MVYNERKQTSLLCTIPWPSFTTKANKKGFLFKVKSENMFYISPISQTATRVLITIRKKLIFVYIFTHKHSRKVLILCPTLCDSIDCSLALYMILQANTWSELFSRGIFLIQRSYPVLCIGVDSSYQASQAIVIKNHVIHLSS